MAEKDRGRDLEAGRQVGGTRGSSSQGGPERSVHRGEEPAKNEALRVNRRHDRGSRSTLGRDAAEEAEAGVREVEDAEQPGRLTDAPRGPLPPGTARRDYVGGGEPRQTGRRGGTGRASGRRNKLG